MPAVCLVLSRCSGRCEGWRKNFSKDPIRNSSKCSLWTPLRVGHLLSMPTGWPLTSHLTWDSLLLLWDSSAGLAKMSETLAPSQAGVNVKLRKQICEGAFWAPSFAQMGHITQYRDFLGRKWGYETGYLRQPPEDSLCQLGSPGGETVMKLPTSAVPFLYKQDHILWVGTDAKLGGGGGDRQREIQGAHRLTLHLITRRKVTFFIP